VKSSPDKKNEISAPSQTVATAQIAPKIFQGQPLTFGSQCTKFHPNRFTFGGVIAERVKAVFWPIEYFYYSPRIHSRRIINHVTNLCQPISCNTTVQKKSTYINSHHCTVSQHYPLQLQFMTCFCCTDSSTVYFLSVSTVRDRIAIRTLITDVEKTIMRAKVVQLARFLYKINL